MIYLPHWRWKILIYYWVGKEDVKEVIDVLYDIGASSNTISQAEENLRGDFEDSGLTYTNDGERFTFIVISRTSSPEEFWNTFDHEKGHAVMHIASALGLPEKGEERQYLAGDIAKETFPVARRFICC